MSIEHIIGVPVRGVALASVLTLAGLSPAPAAAQALRIPVADTCQLIDSAPVAITQPGRYCLSRDVSYPHLSGEAISILADDVVLDCRHHQVNGRQAGAGTRSTGILVADRRNVVIRHCDVRGFYYGIWVDGPAITIEANRIDSNTYTGIRHGGEGGVVRENLVLNTGGSNNPEVGDVFGIQAGSLQGLVVSRNRVIGVWRDPTIVANSAATGIYIWTGNGVVSENHVSEVMSLGTGAARGIAMIEQGHLIARDNTVTHVAPSPHNTGVTCTSATGMVRRNVVNGVEPQLAFFGCSDAGGNFSAP